MPPEEGQDPAATGFSYQSPGTDGKAEFEKIIPDAYREKPWVKDILRSENPKEEIFKQYEHQASLIGKQSTGIQVPPADAPPEAWKAFYKGIGAAEDPKAYEYAAPQWADDEKEIGEWFQSTMTPTFIERLQKSAIDSGLTPKQFKDFMAKHSRSMVDENKSEMSSVAKRNAEIKADFDERAAKLFGDKKDSVITNGKKLLNDTLPDNLKPLIGELDNKSVMILAAVMDSFRQKYIREDNFSASGAAVVASPETIEALRAEGRRLQDLPANKDETHADHDRVRGQVSATYTKIRELLAKSK